VSPLGGRFTARDASAERIEVLGGQTTGRHWLGLVVPAKSWPQYELNDLVKTAVSRK
jgi:hypothetical protein